MSAKCRSKDPAVKLAANQAKYQRRKARGIEHYSREQHLRDRWGLSEQDYDFMLRAQGGVCAICARPPQPNRRLAIDHCHKTTHIRGLLCIRCNLGIGYFCDNKALLLSAIEYLQ